MFSADQNEEEQKDADGDVQMPGNVHPQDSSMCECVSVCKNSTSAMCFSATDEKKEDDNNLMTPGV